MPIAYLVQGGHAIAVLDCDVSPVLHQYPDHVNVTLHNYSYLQFHLTSHTGSKYWLSIEQVLHQV